MSMYWCAPSEISQKEHLLPLMENRSQQSKGRNISHTKRGSVLLGTIHLVKKNHTAYEVNNGRGSLEEDATMSPSMNSAVAASMIILFF